MNASGPLCEYFPFSDGTTPACEKGPENPMYMIFNKDENFDSFSKIDDSLYNIEDSSFKMYVDKIIIKNLIEENGLMNPKITELKAWR